MSTRYASVTVNAYLVWHVTLR